jgi:hypothetical protein
MHVEHSSDLGRAGKPLGDVISRIRETPSGKAHIVYFISDTI